MAYDWVDKELGTKSTGSSAPTPTVRKTTTTKPTYSSPTVNKPTISTKPIHGKYMSGGLVSKGLDILRTPEYALSSFAAGARPKALEYQAEARKSNQTGLQKFGVKGLADVVGSGVKNVLPGVTNRTQLGREQGDYNFGEAVGVKGSKAQTAVNFGTSLALPSAPIGKAAQIVGKVAPKIPGVTKGAEAVRKATAPVVNYAKNTPKVYETLEKVPGLQNFRNPEAGKILNESADVAARRISSLYNKVKDTAKGLKPAEREEIGRIIEGAVSANPKLVQRANYISSISDDIGREVVESGLMSKESFAKFQGKYLAHIADVVKNDKSFQQTKKMLSFSSNSLKQRKDILGSKGKPDYIREFQFPVFKSLSGEIQNVESVKAVKNVVSRFGKEVNKKDLIKSVGQPRTTADGMVYLRDVLPSKVAKQFKGVAVPKEVADYLTKQHAKTSQGIGGMIFDKSLNAWKLGKTIYSGPAYHARNLMSNQILSDYATNAGLPRTVAGYAKAVKAYAGKGDNKMKQYIAEATDAGLLKRMNIEGGVENLKPGVFEKENKLKKIVSAPKKLQNVTEETAKLNVYSFFRNKGLTVKEATKKAEEAIFSPYNLNAAERNALKKIVPFYSFTRQAFPMVAKTALNRGNTVTKYEKAKTAVEGLSPEGAANNEKLPARMKGQVRLPVKDKNGNYQYFDPTFINPAGNFDSEAGGSLPLGLSLNPLITEATSQIYNKDLYFDQPIAKSQIPGRAKAQRAVHLAQTILPNILPTDFLGGIPTGQPNIKIKSRGGSKLYDAFTNQPDYAGRTRSKVQSLLDTFGLKSAPYDTKLQTSFNNSDRAKALKAIQSERRSISMDQRLSPKDKQELMMELNESIKKLYAQ